MVSATNEALLVSVLSESLRRFDKGGDAFYDQTNALYEPVYGSDSNDALYWFCRMPDNGADPRHLVRRIIRMAWEDVGLVGLRAGRIMPGVAETYERPGSPEGKLALVQVVIYLVIAPEPNTDYSAYSAARAFVSQDESRNASMHLRNASTKLMKELGYGYAYRYAHDEPEAYIAGETHLPDDLPVQDWYVPTPHGPGGKIGEKLRHLRELDAQRHAG